MLTLSAKHSGDCTCSVPVQDSAGRRAWLPETSSRASAGQAPCRGSPCCERPARSSSRCAMASGPLSCTIRPHSVPGVHTRTLIAFNVRCVLLAVDIGFTTSGLGSLQGLHAHLQADSPHDVPVWRCPRWRPVWWRRQQPPARSQAHSGARFLQIVHGPPQGITAYFRRHAWVFRVQG